MGIKNLYYKDAGDWVQIPIWVSFFISLGGKLAELIKERTKWTLALTVPTKAYVAPFIGLGILSSVFMKSSPDDLLEGHFQMLASLEKGTFVWYRKKQRVLKAKFLGITIFQGEQRLLVQIQSTKAGGLTEYISKKDVLDIQINPNQSSQLPKNQRGRTINSESQFANAVFGIHSQSLQKRSETKICFVGGREQFENEIGKTIFAVHEDKRYVKGTLNELLRIRQFLNTVDPYQSQFVSSLARKNEIDLSLNLDTVVIYSGSNSYLNWKENFLSENSVIILDRSEPQFGPAVEEVNNRYIESNYKTFSDLGLESMPGGLELIFWEEAR